MFIDNGLNCKHWSVCEPRSWPCTNCCRFSSNYIKHEWECFIRILTEKTVEKSDAYEGFFARRCWLSWRSTLSSAWYIFSNKPLNKEKTKKSPKSMLNAGYPNLAVTVIIFSVFTRWVSIMLELCLIKWLIAERFNTLLSEHCRLKKHKIWTTCTF